ncbi:unnamed protein product [Hyaloperonospora brassicae]|uniref:Uncharacterized protein n=1 Tax=Hyaloperonospora brassicae TaxID=162125 RepID=A0AAV0TX13_HYABA|nr:unnamed protein product [Hyaloperonospora brassicae]
MTPEPQPKDEEGAAAAAVAQEERQEERVHDREPDECEVQKQTGGVETGETQPLQEEADRGDYDQSTGLRPSGEVQKAKDADRSAATAQDTHAPMENGAASAAETAPALATSTSSTGAKRKRNAPETSDAVRRSSHTERKQAKPTRSLMQTETTGKHPTKAAKTATEFAFARPTASSARRTAAVAENQAHVKAAPPLRKMLHSKKRLPTAAERLSTPVATLTGVEKASRAHCGYTPYTGPLPPLTVESSFAPKNGQGVDRGVRSALPAPPKVAASARKPRPASAKKTRLTGTKNCGVHADGVAATNAASSSRTSVHASKTGSSSVNK